MHKVDFCNDRVSMNPMSADSWGQKNQIFGRTIQHGLYLLYFIKCKSIRQNFYFKFLTNYYHSRLQLLSLLFHLEVVNSNKSNSSISSLCTHTLRAYSQLTCTCMSSRIISNNDLVIWRFKAIINRSFSGRVVGCEI